MSISSLYSIEVTADIAEKIRILAETGVFAAKGGSVELHFDTQGNISQVITHSYKKIRKLSPGVLPTDLHSSQSERSMNIS